MRARDHYPDGSLRANLKTDPAAQAAVLAWVVSGARDWYASDRLVAPECVVARTDEWRRDTDRVGGWLEDECDLDPEAWESSDSLQNSINNWWKTYVQETGWDPPSLMAGLGDELRARGCRPHRKGDTRTRGWAGDQGFLAGVLLTLALLLGCLRRLLVVRLPSR